MALKRFSTAAYSYDDGAADGVEALQHRPRPRVILPTLRAGLRDSDCLFDTRGVSCMDEVQQTRVGRKIRTDTFPPTRATFEIVEA